MKIIQKIKYVAKDLDKLNPSPFLYPFRVSEGEKAIFDKIIKPAKMILEFGSGGSTIRALKKSKAIIYSVESSIDWIHAMREYLLIRRFENKRLFFHHVDIGKTGGWGYPEGDDSRSSYPNYSRSIFNLVNGNDIDVAFIDGRFRVACTLATILACYQNINSRILIHDFWDRERYHVVLKYLDVIERVDTLGIFSIKKDINLALVEKDYNTYKYSPE